ncbi:MAG: hypothetical protein WCQ57_10335, partial [Verrucomicrobiota bacterium]
MFSVVVGASRFAHTDCLHSDKALQAMLGISRFPGTDTIGNLLSLSQKALQPVPHTGSLPRCAW